MKKLISSLLLVTVLSTFALCITESKFIPSTESKKICDTTPGAWFQCVPQPPVVDPVVPEDPPVPPVTDETPILG